MTSRRTLRLLDQFWRSQARIGVETSAQALDAWSRVNPTALEVTGPAWLAFVLQVIRGARERSRRNAVAFYRLYRALETGYTVAPEHVPAAFVPPRVSLGQLRQEWSVEAGLPHAVESDDSQEIPVEPFEWPKLEPTRLDRAAAVSLASTGVARAQEVVKKATEAEGRGRLDDPEFLASLESAGRGAANVADREAIRAGRELVDGAAKRDQRVVGWARVTDGSPCHFCAMLASRGAVYTSKERAGLGGRAKPKGSPDGRVPKYKRPPVSLEDMKKYHPGCHCQVVPIYSRNDFITPEARSLRKEWDDVTANLSGDNARRAWRRHIESRKSRD